MSFESVLTRVLPIEGGFSDAAADRGGATMWGVTESLARAHGYAGTMRDMPREFAESVYRTEFWDALQLGRVEQFSPELADEMFECAVNLGRHRLATFFQRVLNAFNRQSKLYADIAVDGVVGAVTLRAFMAFLSRRGLKEGPLVMRKALNALQGEWYIRLAENDPSQEEFVYGWIRNRV